MILNSCIDRNEGAIDVVTSDTDIGLITLEFNPQKLYVSQNFEDFKIVYESSIDKDLIKSELKVVTIKNDEIIYKTDYFLDTTQERYKLWQADKVIEAANKVENLSLEEVTKIDENLSSFFTNVIEEYQDKEILPILNSLYFHKSILAVKERQLKNKEKNCKCTTHPGYLVGKTGFVCQEDFIVPVRILKEILNEPEGRALHNKGENEQEKFNKYIAKYIDSNEESISFDKVYSFFVNKEHFQTAKTMTGRASKGSGKCDALWQRFLAYGTKGSDNGCCGNYEGCCYYWSFLCYLHDKICVTCKPRWFCTSLCKP